MSHGPGTQTDDTYRPDLHAPMRISLGIPLYEPSPRYLADTIASIRAQTRPADEVVFTDDSQPTVRSWVSDLAAGLPYRFVENAERFGMVGNWNEAVRATTGTHVVVTHQDDMLEPRALEVMAGVFEQNADIGIMAVSEIACDASGVPLRGPVRANHRDRLFISTGVHAIAPREMVYLMLRHGQIFGPPTAMMFRRDRFDEIGGFDGAYTQSVDVDFAVRMSRAGGAAYANERLVRYRYHPSNATKENIASGRNLADRTRLYEEHFVPGDYTKREAQRVKANLQVRAAFDGARALRNGRFAVAGRAARDAWRFRVPPHVLGLRLSELARKVNNDAR